MSLYHVYYSDDVIRRRGNAAVSIGSRLRCTGTSRFSAVRIDTVWIYRVYRTDSFRSRLDLRLRDSVILSVSGILRSTRFVTIGGLHTGLSSACVVHSKLRK